ncbi:hypothetical protein [Vibrio harveyi]|uniref:hypothetical protein n=1 Tax=Vibrio harveyi TaxID=669 RepID=UPI003BB49FFF|nr:hypothetical protein [Vibrio harveyi]
MKIKELYIGFALLSLFATSPAFANVEAADVYINKAMVLLTLVAGVFVFLIFLWGFVTVQTIWPKIPEIRENSTDRDAKIKVILKFIGGILAMAGPAIVVAVLYSIFGADGVIQFFYSDGAESQSKALGVLNQLSGSD